MRTIRNLIAAMLIGSAAVAFQVDASAQSRSVNRSSSTNTQKQTATRSSSTRQSSTRSSSAVKPSAQTRKPSVQATRPSSPGGQTATRPSSTQNSRPSSTQNSRPSVQNNRPATQTARPSSGNGSVNKPSSGNASVNRPSENKQTATRPAATRPATRPAAQNSKPSAQTKPSSTKPESRPQSGAVATRKPSPTVNRPSAGQAKPDTRPAQRPGAGSAYKPDHAKPPVKVQPNHKPDRPRVHPSHRDFIAYDRPAHFWNPNYHYFGYRVRVLPAKARLFRHHGIAYYCYNDIWYRPFGGYYVICRPPFGTVLAANLIADMAWTAVRFSYYNTVFNTYRQINENSRYIAEQNEIIAKNNATIAAQNAAIAMNQKQAASAFTLADELGLVQSYAAANAEYFYQDGVFYAQDPSGEYKVIVPPAGALVDSLPDDYEMVTLGGEEYYKVDDTVYKVTLNDGKPFFEVLGQLYS